MRIFAKNYRMKKEDDHQKYRSALSVQSAIPQPPSVNPDIKGKLPKRQTLLPVDRYVEGVLAGDHVILGKAITLVESAKVAHQRVAQQVVAACLPYTEKAIRIGITGVPGVGKSTFIEAFGKHLIEKGKKVAVLAIDPSSQRTKGSILGDKTRMEELSTLENAFIRPSPSAGSLGGVARRTRETSLLCEAAGFDYIIIETVGVGQSEISVHAMVDFFLLLMLAGAGDELQGIKRGIMEMADGIAINKADGDNTQKAEMARVQYQSALNLFPKPASNWSPKVLSCSSINGNGITDILAMITDYIDFTVEQGYFEHKRVEQNHEILKGSIESALYSSFFDDSLWVKKLEQKIKEMDEKRVSPYVAAQTLFEQYKEALDE